MNPDTHALAGAYAVNAVTDEERHSFELHLSECADCRAEVAVLRAAAATLATEVELPPPPALRASVLSAISQTRQLSPLISTPASPLEQGDSAVWSQGTPTPSPADVPEAAPQDMPAAPVDGPADELAAHRHRRQRRFAPWIAGVAAAVAVTVGALTWQPWEEPPPKQLTATERVLSASDAQRLEQPMGASEISIVRSLTVGRAVFVADAMPAAPSGKVFQLWLDMPGRGMVNAGLIKGSGAVTIPLEGDAKTATGAGITVEPASGSEHPTSAPVALFSFA